MTSAVPKWNSGDPEAWLKLVTPKKTLARGKMKARLYIAGAIEDASFPDDMKARLETALSAAKVDHKIETYPAKHGWVLRDTPIYDEAACERHWRTLTKLFDDVLKHQAAR